MKIFTELTNENGMRNAFRKNRANCRKIHYKYVHILWCKEQKFSIPFVKKINYEKTYFNSEDHLFLTPHKLVYDEIKNFDNVVLVPDVNIINKYGDIGDWIIVHYLSGCNPIKVLFTKTKYAKKVIMRSWGGDELRPYRERVTGKGFFDVYIRNIYATLYHNLLKKFYMFGIANIVDEIEIKSILGDNIRTYPIHYDYIQDDHFDIEQIKKDSEKSHVLRVLIGNSANSRNKHIELLDTLSKYKDENIEIYLILSYGAAYDYIQKVKEHALSVFGEKAHFLEEFLSKSEYVKFVSMMDVGIIADKSSRALGLLFYLCALEKKVYIERDGSIDKAIVQSNNLPYPYYIDSIEKSNILEFSVVDDSVIIDMKKIFGINRSDEENFLILKGLFDMLDKEKQVQQKNNRF